MGSCAAASAVMSRIGTCARSWWRRCVKTSSPLRPGRWRSNYAISYLALLALLGQLAGHQSNIAVRIGYIFLIAAIGALFAHEAVLQTLEKSTSAN